MTSAHFLDADSFVVAVVVTFHPDSGCLLRQWTSLLGQVSAVVWVDNGTHANVRAIAARCGSPAPTVIAMGHNAGLGAAQNAGIAWARRKGATHVLLLDQDSIPHPMMVGCLLAALGDCPDAAAAGPKYFDARNPDSSSAFVQISGIQTHRCPCDDATRVWRVDHLIASGCLIPIWALDKVGCMREEFFIDFIDVEWCLRARSLGNVVLGVCAARLSHQLGERHVKALGRMRQIHSPLRLYYQVRNALWLYRMPHIALGWKWVSAWRLLLKCLFYLMYVQPRLAYLRHMISGAASGIFDTLVHKRVKL